MKKTITLILCGMLVMLASCKKDEPVPAENSALVKALSQDPYIQEIKVYNINDIISEGLDPYRAKILGTYKECLEFLYIQPVDHYNPSGPTFYQRVRLFYAGPNTNTVLHTAGYSLSENMEMGFVSLSLKGGYNLVEVEHRYFYGSDPSGIDPNYTYFNAVQESADLHDVTTSLKKVLGGKWIATGCSKNGITTALYANHYPNDMDVYVPFDAPFCIGRKDSRIAEYLNNKIGTSEQRQKLYNSQVMALDRMDEIAAYIYQKGEGKGSSEIPSAKLESYRDSVKIGVLARFYQMWTSQAVDKWINLVPQKENSSTISTDSLYRYYYKYMFEKDIPDMPLDSYTLTYPYYIQAWLELGFFSDELYLSRFDPKYELNPEKHGRDLKNELTKEDFAKIGSREFNSATMHNVVKFINNTGGTKMVMVYGANDYWTGAGVKKEECDPQNVKYHLITRGTHTDNLDEFEIESEADAVWNDIQAFLNK